MTAGSCGNPSPEQNSTCELASGNHRLCTGWAPDLDAFIDWDNPDYREPKRIAAGRTRAREQVSEMASRVPRAPSVLTRAQAAVEGSERASRTWTAEERAEVYRAIVEVADERTRFTTDDIWRRLGPDFPVTMGIAAVLRRAVTDGHIRKTSRTEMSHRDDRADHDLGRHLRVWESARVTRE
jgi:hypothetical protein